MSNPEKLRSDMLTQLEHIHRTLTNLEGNIAELSGEIDVCVDFLCRFQGFLWESSSPSSSPSSTQEVEDTVETMVKILEARPELLRALGISHKIWHQHDDYDDLERMLLETDFNTNKLKRIHDAFAAKCTEASSSKCGTEDDAWPLFMWVLGKVAEDDTVSPEFTNIEMPEIGSRYFPQTMRATRSVVSGRVARVLMPGVPRLKLKAVVEVKQG